MPIFEFKCLKCNDIVEMLLMKNDQEIELKCPNCHSESVERVLSASGYKMNGGAGQPKGATAQTKSCSSGSCTTYDIPGPAR